MLLAKYDYSLLVVKNIWILRVHQCIRDLVVSTGMAKQDIFVWFFLGFFFTDFCSLLFVFFFFFGILRVHQNALARYAGKHRNGKLANRIFCQYCESVVVNKAVWIWWQLVSILSGDLFSVTAATKHSSQPEDCFTLHLNFNLNFNLNKYFNKHFYKYFTKYFKKKNSLREATKQSLQPKDCFTLNLNFNLNLNFKFNKYFNNNKYYKYFQKY